MGKFRIQPHGRLQEWVAEDLGFFKDEGLDYEFVTSHAAGRLQPSTVQSAEGAPPVIQEGAFESFEQGRVCEISSACHWAVNMAASAAHGRMWGHAYSMTNSGIYVPPESPIVKPTDLANVEIGVGYHSGSHFSALQALASILAPGELKLRFIGLPNDRLESMLARTSAAANVFGAPAYLLEQQGFRRIVDTTFMIGFLFSADADIADVEAYFRALQRAQAEIDLHVERYKHHLLEGLPDQCRAIADVRTFGPGERIVFADYTRSMYEETHRWMETMDLFPADQRGAPNYEVAVAV